ncbi:transmembrane, partial [Cystoisospora suis]
GGGGGGDPMLSSSSPGDPEFSQLEYQPRGDEGGVIATVSLMIFLNCRHMLAPIAINQLLVGPNMIKAIRY